MEVPYFLKQEGLALLYNEDNKELQYWIPDKFFEKNVKNSIAEVIGDRVSTIGLFDYCIVDHNGKRSPFKAFRFPAMILCKPYEIEKVKDFVIKPGGDPEDYRVLHFKKGDEAICEYKVPSITFNVELFYKMACLTAKLPSTIRDDEIWQLYYENMELAGAKYGLHSQIFGIATSELCRDPNDVSKPFRTSGIKDRTAYKLIPIKMHPKYVSPYTAITSEGFDEGVLAAINMSNDPKRDPKDSPLEKILMQ